MGRKTRGATLFALAMGWCFAAGGPAAGQTLADTLATAYNNSNLLAQNRAVLRAADEDVATAVAALRPTLDYSLSRDWGFRDEDSVQIDNDTVSNTLSLTSDLTLFEFGRNRLAIEAAKEAVLAARQSLRAEEQGVLFDAVEAYVEVRRALEFVDLRQNNVRVLSEEVRAANDRFEVGEVTRTDVAQAESRLALAESNLASARGDLEIAREQYNLTVGQYPQGLAAPPSLPNLPAGATDARAISMRLHPSILQAQRLVSVAELNVARAEAAVLPSLSATASVGYADGGQNGELGDFRRSGSVGINLRGPIYRGGALNSTYRSAVAQRDQNRANLLQTTRAISEQVGRAWAVLQVARASLAATARQIDAARIAFEGTREEATLGARTTLDVLNAEQELLNAQGDRIEANAREQVAVYGLLSAMGQLTVDYLGLGVVEYDPSVYYNAVRSAPPITSERGLQLDRVLKSIGRN